MPTLVLAAITLGALVLFATEKLRADLVAIIVTLALALTGLISVEQAFAGFSNPAVITVAGIFIMSAGLLRTGGADHLIRLLRRLGGKSERRLIGATVVLVGLLSSFMNNVGATIIVMPAVVAVAREVRISPGRLLIPLAFGSLLGGLTTVIGTPPNLLISLALVGHGYVPFRLFDFTPTGIIVLVVGAVFLAVFGPRLLPARDATAGSDTIDKDQALSTEVLVAPRDSDAHRVRQIVAEFGLTILAVIKHRDDGHREVAAANLSPATDRADRAVSERTRLCAANDAISRTIVANGRRAGMTLKHPGVSSGSGDLGAVDKGAVKGCVPETGAADNGSVKGFVVNGDGVESDAVESDSVDRGPVDSHAVDDGSVDGSALEGGALLVEGPRDNLLRAAASRRVRILAELKHPPGIDSHAREVRLAEATLAPRSALAGKTLRELDFYHRYGLTVIGIRRHGESIREPLAEVRLRFGDTLLLRGRQEHIRRLGPDSDFLLLEPIENPAPDYSRTTRAVLIFTGAIMMATVGGMHISLAATLGAVAMVLSGCLRVEDAHRAIDWRTLIAIGGMFPLGTALETTGTATLIAESVARLASGGGPLIACAVLGLATVGLTQILTNAATAIVVAPIALGVANTLGVSPYPIMMIVAIAASTAFVTPIGHQSNLLVYNAGGYRFDDFVKVGLPLTLLILTVSLLTVPLFWPF